MLRNAQGSAALKLERDGIFSKAERGVKRAGGVIGRKNFERDAPSGKYFIEQEPHGRTTDTHAAAMPLDEELANVMAGVGGAIKGVGEGCGGGKENRGVIGADKRRHAIAKLRDGHGVGVPLIGDEAVVHFSEQRKVVGCGAAPSKRLHERISNAKWEELYQREGRKAQT